MLARMYWKKVVSRGKQCYQVTKLENFKCEEQLPEKYVNNLPCMSAFVDYFGDSNQYALHISYPEQKTNVQTHMIIRVGNLLSASEKENAVHWMKVCGKRLTSINKKLAIANDDWTGEGFDEI